MSMIATDRQAHGSLQEPVAGNHSEPQELLTFNEAMSYLRVSRSTLYRFMWSGQLTGRKAGSTWRFYPTDLQRCIH